MVKITAPETLSYIGVIPLLGMVVFFFNGETTQREIYTIFFKFYCQM